MRVLFTTWAWPSHYLPLVPLAWALRTAGHEVLMTSQPALVPAMLSSGLPVTAVGRDLDFAEVHLSAARQLRASTAARKAGQPPARRHSGRFSDLLLATEPDPRVRDRMQALIALRDAEYDAMALYRIIRAGRVANGTNGMSIYGEIADTMVDGLHELAATWKPDLIVHDPLTYAGPIVASLLGIPAVRNMFGPDVTYFADAGESAGMVPLFERLGVGPVKLIGAATVDQCPPSMQFPDAMVPTQRIRHRYVPYNGLAEVPRWVYEAPEKPRICVTWGTSMVRLSGDEAFLPDAVVQGASKLAQDRGAELVLAITSAQRKLLTTPLPDHVRVAESVPLQALLPTCQALMHQGGAGTTLTALSHGLPQLVFTHIPDQAANAHTLVASGAGRTLHVGGLDAATVLNQGHELLDDPVYTIAALRVQQEMREQPAPAEIIHHLMEIALGDRSGKSTTAGARKGHR